MNKLLLVAVLGLVVLGACSSNKQTGPSSKDPFIGGTTGVTLAFEEDAPPAAVYDGGEFPFSVVIRLKNEGEFTVPKNKAKVTLSGILASEFSVAEADLSAQPEDDLEAMRKEGEGGIVDSTPVYVSFDDLNFKNTLVGNSEYTIRADVCAVYETKGVSKLCIRKDNLDTDEGVCIVNEAKKTFSSGAPIKIMDLKESARSKDKIAFTFQVTREGSGRLFQQDTSCDPDRKYEDRVWVSVDTGLEGLECLGLREGDATSGYLTLYGDSKPVTCTQTVSTQSDYEKEVNIKLVYDYQETKETKLLVRHSLS